MNKCPNDKCRFLTHSGKFFEAYCCAKCRSAHSRGTSEHGKRCERLKASMDGNTSVTPSSCLMDTGGDGSSVVCFDLRMKATSIFCVRCEDKSAHPFSFAKSFANEFFKASDVNRKELHINDLSGWELHLYDALTSKFPGEGFLLTTVEHCQAISVGIATNKEARERAAKLGLAFAAIQNQACSMIIPSLQLGKVVAKVHRRIIYPDHLAGDWQQDACHKASSLEDNRAEPARAHPPAVPSLGDSCEQDRPRCERVIARSRSKRKRTLPTGPAGPAAQHGIIEILSGDEDDDSQCSRELDKNVMSIIRVLEEGRGQVASLERYAENASSSEYSPSVASIMRQQQHYEAAVLQILSSHLKSGDATKAAQPSLPSSSISETSIAEALATASSKALPKPLPRQKAQPCMAKPMPRKPAQCGKIGTSSHSAGRNHLPLDAHEDIVAVDTVLQTHDAVSSRFSDGRSFEALIESLSSGNINPLEASFLQLQVFKWPGKGYYSINNRRLLCLKKHQEIIRQTDPNYVVKVRVHVRPLPDEFIQLMSHDSKFEKFVRAYSTRTEGKSVAIRGHMGSSGQSWTRR